MKHFLLLTACTFSLAACNSPTVSQDGDTEAAQETRENPVPTAQEIESGAHYSPATGNTNPTRVFWGDTHLHTNLSQDAFTFGVTLGPDEAYKFAKGEPVKATHGEIAQLERPLDFLVVSDHAEGLGAMQALLNGDEELLKSERLQQWRDGFLVGTAEG